KADFGGSTGDVAKVPQPDMAFCHFGFARSFATSRACSMKSRATGLSVRLFRVTTPLGTRVVDSSTGKTLSSGRLMENFNVEAGKTVRNRPVTRRLIRTCGESVIAVARG